MTKFDYVSDILDGLRRQGLYRKLRCVDSAQGPDIKLHDRKMLLFASNNYLNLANHPDIIKAFTASMAEYGVGAAASRLISGTMTPHVQAEKVFADLFAKQAALLFPSGWTANETVLRTLPGKGDLVLLDKLDHASIIDAVRGCGADFRTYRRTDLARLEKMLADDKYSRKFIVTESIFSMDGDMADLSALVELKNRYDAYLIVDEAHSLGCFGDRGAGLAEHAGLLEDVDVVVATLSKAAGLCGGVVAATENAIDLLINRGRAFIYTTAMLPAVAAGAVEAVRLFRDEPWRREKLRENANYLRDKLNNAGFDIGQSSSHIVPVIIGQAEKAVAIADELFQRGFYIPAIRPPTVAAGSSRLRISLQAEHTFEQIDLLVRALGKLAD